MTPPAPTSSSPDRLRFLALGDSYTIGEAVPPESRWPVLMADALRTRGVAIAAPEIIAKTGWTTDELSAAIDEANPQGPYDLVSLLIGVNNQYRGGRIKVYRAEFRALLQRAIGFAGDAEGRVIVVSIPDWSVTPFAAEDMRGREHIRTRIDAFNAVAREETAKVGAHFIDITPISRTAASDFSLVADDGLHPASPMYAAWADLVLPVALDALGAST